MTKTIILESAFIKSAIGVIYRMAPYHKPRKIDEIVDHIHHEFTTRGKKFLDTYYFEYDQDEVYKLVEEILKTCAAFNELNLSQNEVDRGIGLEDENRAPFVVISRDTTLQDYHDFIDLDACVRRIASDLYWDWLDVQLYENKAEIVFKSSTPEEEPLAD